MRKVLCIIALALTIAPAASAKNPHDQTEPTPTAPTIVGGPTKDGGGPAKGDAAPAAPATAVTSSGDCGACIVQCWGVTSRAGAGDWSGHVWIYHRINWCGNGAWITSADAAQSYDQSGWYHLDAGYGPWWSSGCVGCGSLTLSGYIMWTWTAQLIGISHSGTSYLNTTVYAYGGAAAS